MSASTHLVLIPTFNTGARLLGTVVDALKQWPAVWVVVDGSTDGSDAALDSLAHPGLRVLRLRENVGKGGAVLAAAAEALRGGFTHALVMDADGQHPAAQIGQFLDTSRRNPGALVLGAPVFDDDAPFVRLHGRKLSVGLVHLETFGRGIRDPLFGFRVYPLEPLVRIMNRCRFGRRYDFDPEIAVRLHWSGCAIINLPATCRYIPRSEGGVSHFNYLRDNARMVWLHARLLTELALWRWPAVCRNRNRNHR
jgi:glycosyltransferase involved in cell wall biosynthesis